MFSLWDAQSEFDRMLTEKITRFLQQWLPAVETELDVRGLDAAMYVVYEQPFTGGGPFAQIPKAIVTGAVKYLGRLAPSDEPRRGLSLGLHTMQQHPDPGEAAEWVEKQLVYVSRPESYFFTEK